MQYGGIQYRMSPSGRSTTPLGQRMRGRRAGRACPARVERRAGSCRPPPSRSPGSCRSGGLRPRSDGPRNGAASAAMRAAMPALRSSTGSLSKMPARPTPPRSQADCRCSCASAGTRARGFRPGRPRRPTAVVSTADIGMKPPVRPFDRHRKSGVTPACSQANKRAGAAEADRDLIGDQVRAMRVADLPRPLAGRPGDACACRRRTAPAVRGSARRFRLRWRAKISSSSSARRRRKVPGRFARLGVVGVRRWREQGLSAAAAHRCADTAGYRPSTARRWFRRGSRCAGRRTSAACRRRDCRKQWKLIFSAISTAAEPLSA